VRRMSAVTDSAETVERGDVQCGGEFPSEPPPTVHSPTERPICAASDFARAKRVALILRSRADGQSLLSAPR